jgi:hypothetical protein
MADTPDRWTGVKFPDAAIDPGKGVGDGTSDEGLAWHPAPPTSHLHSFAVAEGSGRRTAVVGGPSWVLVRFRDKAGSITAKYRYQFRDAESARRVFEQMAGMEHPGKHLMVQAPGKGVPGLVGYTRS